MNKKWWKEAVVYQVYPRSFKDSNNDGIGDLRGIIEKIDHLDQLGVDAVWLNPVYKSPNDDNGYDISDYQAIMDEFGTVEDLEELMELLHQRNIKLIMDLVLNHSSDEHQWFKESRQSKDNPYRDYYIWRDGKNGGPPNNWKAFFGGSAWKYDQKTDQYYLHLFSPKQPDLNWENPKVREEIYEMINWWLEKGVDGFRLDVINLISKDQRFPDGKKEGLAGHEYFANGPRVHEFIKEMAANTFNKYEAMTVGETPFVDKEEAIKFVKEEREEFSMVIPFEHLEFDRKEGWDKITDWDLTELKDLMSEWQYKLQENNGWTSLYFCNHDQPRIVSRYGDDGKYRKESAKMLGTMLHTLRGTPFIYQGEEIGMTNISFDSLTDFDDIETRGYIKELQEKDQLTQKEILEIANYRTRDNARTPMHWNDSKYAGFSESEPWLKMNSNYPEINVEKDLSSDDSVFKYYQKMISLRKKYPVFAYGKYDILLEADQNIYAYQRQGEQNNLLVLLNFSENDADYDLNDQLEIKQAELILNNYQKEADFELKSSLRPYEARVYLY
ncbi:oligo-1,6-glucosidase [Halanaerobium saccharolyticum]|uniref:Oligo-1,6-glucosidase n=1 Tax=Halanaerobium saccharolyticum TaxID=43595 RepID=A0A4R7Z8Y6_9FIRM|nr:alpha-glucosidase [Halanaerobium saccharolyticum]RAK11876.1 oligo-1,6-glucosidase [Halanaerobium saccharolyticum]TDW07717.1 oligo-1,6-glucosidase [Halanaerobium saccharolyticum]TDX64638.1 oligo-1,6-glucosidase [Halanaerobium saccharolyticum]